MNPFERYAAENKPAHELRKERIAEKRKSKREERLLAVNIERSQLETLYRKARKLHLEELFAIPDYGPHLKRLAEFLKSFSVAQAGALVDLLDHSPWLATAPLSIKFEALHMVNLAMITAREDAGLVPFDDPWPGQNERQSLFFTIKEKLCP